MRLMSLLPGWIATGDISMGMWQVADLTLQWWWTLHVHHQEARTLGAAMDTRDWTQLQHQ
jgi:hypothetical protein